MVVLQSMAQGSFDNVFFLRNLTHCFFFTQLITVSRYNSTDHVVACIAVLVFCIITELILT